MSYAFDLKGSSQSIDTACSSSLVATHAVAGELRAGDARRGLAIGVSLTLSPLKSGAFNMTGVHACVGRA